MPESDSPALVADIGATNARFALIVPGGRDIVAPLVLPCAQFPGLGEAALAYLDRAKPARKPRLAAFAVAGPVLGDVVTLTNHPWRIVVPEVRAVLGLDRIEMMNDFVAQARSVPLLADGDRALVLPGAPGARGPIAVVGPGTGLGVGAIVPDGSRWIPIATEGGHATLAAADDRDAAVLSWLRARFGHASAERVLSGPGLVNLYEAVAALANAEAASVTPAQVAERAEVGDRLAVETVELFLAMLGGFAGSLALIFGARGGVAVAGGIVPRLLPMLPASRFAERFLAKGRFRDYLAAIPVQVVTHPLPAFLGLAGLLADAA